LLVFLGLVANNFSSASPDQKNSNQNRFSLYNLSILLPLPKNDLGQAWGLEALACSENLLPQELFLKVPALLRVPYSVQQQYQEMRLVGVRFDPIEEETRLVFQPLLWAEWNQEAKGFWAEDAAIHLFFKTPLQKILTWQQELKKKFGSINQQLLGVHPYFKNRQNANDLNIFMCELAEKGPHKLTFMNVRGARVLWSFGGFELKRGADGELRRAEDVQIPNAERVFIDENDANMSVQRVARVAGSIRAGVLPKPSRGDHLMAFFLNEASNSVPHPEQIRETVDRIENPNLNTPQTVDCVSCHAAESTRMWLERRYQSTPTKHAYQMNKDYGLDMSVSEVARRNTASFRIFGYLDAEAVVARRVLVDSVHAQRFLENIP
jgi:hypothetical protein